MNVWGKVLVPWGKPKARWQKDAIHMVAVQGGLILQACVSASSLFFVVAKALAATWEAEIWPSSSSAEGVWKGGGSQCSYFLGFLVAQACLVAGWGQGGPCDFQVVEKRRGFVQDNPLMRTAVSKPGEAAGISVKGVGVLLVHPCSLSCLTVLWTLTWERVCFCLCLSSSLLRDSWIVQWYWGWLQAAGCTWQGL